MDAHYFAAVRETEKTNKQKKSPEAKNGNEPLRTTKYDKYEHKQHKLYGTGRLAYFYFSAIESIWVALAFREHAPHALPCKHQPKIHTDVIGETEPWQTKLGFQKQKYIWPKMACSAPHNRAKEDVNRFCCRVCLYIVWQRDHESCYLYLQCQIQKQSRADYSGSDT